MIINMLRASGLWYTATVVNMPDWVNTRVSKAIWGFLWNGKTELVKRESCRLPWQHGGLSVVNPLEKARALKLRWVPSVGDTTCEKKWVFFARYWIGFPLRPPHEGLGVSTLQRAPKAFRGCQAPCLPNCSNCGRPGRGRFRSSPESQC